MATERTRLVETLREDEFQTVAQLSAALKIDEATVAEHLQQLEQDGLPLQSASDCGFRLLEGIAPIDAENLVEELEKAAFPYARQVEILDTVDSTSDWLSRQQSGGVDIHGKACITEFQSAGRGRRGRNWRGSPYCHLMFSMGWRFQKEDVEMTGLSLSVGVAVADSLRNLSGAPVGLKWPNDLFLYGRKLAGFLPSVTQRGSSVRQLRIGFGLNICNPVPIEGIALDQLDRVGSHDPARWTAEILLALDRCQQIGGDGSWCLPALNRLLWAKQIQHPKDGRTWMISGVASDGALQLHHGTRYEEWRRWSS